MREVSLENVPESNPEPLKLYKSLDNITLLLTQSIR